MIQIFFYWYWLLNLPALSNFWVFLNYLYQCGHHGIGSFSKPLILAWYWVQDRILAGMRHIRNLVHTIEFDIRQVYTTYVIVPQVPTMLVLKVDIASGHTSLVGPLIPKFG